MTSRGLRNAEVARRLSDYLPGHKKVSPASISQYRGGRSVPRDLYLHALSKALEVEESELLPPGVGNATLSEPEIVRPPAKHMREQSFPSMFSLEDRGNTARLRLDQELPWPMVVQILAILKG